MNTPTLHIGLSDENRSAVCTVLHKLLANTIVLTTKTKVSHWNVEDPRFHSLHQMFDEQYEQLSDAVDEIAERIRSLGEKTALGLKAYSEQASLKDFEKDEDANGMLKALLEDHEHIARELREAIPVAEDNGDDGTADFLTARLEDHEKTAWMLRSSL